MNYKSFNLGDWIGHISGVIEDESELDGNEMRDLVEFLTTMKGHHEALEQQPCEDWYDVPSDEMTLEQARQAVKDLRKKLAEYLEQQPCEEGEQMTREEIVQGLYRGDSKAIKAAIETLEQESCDDCISRQAVLALPTSKTRTLSGEIVEEEVDIKLIKALPSVTPKEKTGWIPVSERLPEEGQIVLVCQIYSWTEFEEGTEVTIAQYKRKHFTWYRYQKDWDKHTSIMTHGDICPGNEYVTAWMPLPEPYKAESEDKE